MDEMRRDTQRVNARGEKKKRKKSGKKRSKVIREGRKA